MKDDIKKRRRSAKELGYSAAELAAKRAGEAWKRAAYGAFVGMARTKPFLTTEDVRLGCELPEPPDRRAWGSITRAAKAERLIEFFAWEASPSRICHGRPINIWKSLIWKKRA